MKIAGSHATYLKIFFFCIDPSPVYGIIIHKNVSSANPKHIYRERSCFARARLSIIEWIIGTINIATIPPAKPLL